MRIRCLSHSRLSRKADKNWFYWSLRRELKILPRNNPITLSFAALPAGIVTPSVGTLLFRAIRSTFSRPRSEKVSQINSAFVRSNCSVLLHIRARLQLCDPYLNYLYVVAI